MKIKRFLKSLFNKLGFDVVRYVPELNKPFPLLPLIVKERLSTGETIFFVQIGANDGVLDDDLRELIHKYHLPGLMIEPQPQIFKRLCKNYETKKNLLFENVAISAHEGSIAIYCIAPDAPLDESYSGLASLERKHLVDQGVPERYIEECSVPAVRLKTLLEKHAIKQVDLLAVDVEGYDYELIKDVFNSQIFPAIIYYEHCHLVPCIRHECKRILWKHGYRFVEVGKDTLAIRGDSLGDGAE